MKDAKLYTPRELMGLHVQALFIHDLHGWIVTINEPDGGGSAPCFFLGRTADGNLWRFRSDLPANLVAELETLCRTEPTVYDLRQPPQHLAKYEQLLQADSSINQVWMGPTYYFDQIPQPTRLPLAHSERITEATAARLQSGFQELIPELPTWQPFIGLVDNGQVVSVCRSVRITANAHEAGVETLPDFRGRGHASAVVTEWARSVKDSGALPMYGTSWENHASQAVAKKLGLIPYGSDFHIT